MRRCSYWCLALGTAFLNSSCEGADRPPDTGAEADSVPVMVEGYVDVTDGVRLFYRTVGRGDDTIVVLHGGPGLSFEYFGDDLAPLAERNTLLFYDQRGGGRSTLVDDSTGLAAHRFADDLEAVRQHFNLDRMILFAHSWGAGVAALYATQYPERVERLVIVGGIPLEQHQLDQAFRELFANRDTATQRRMTELWESRVANPGDSALCREYLALYFVPFFADSSAANRSTGDFCTGSPEALRNQMNNVGQYTMASLGEWDWRESLRDVAAPALVMHGTVDPIPMEGARGWAQALPNGRLMPMEGIGHFPYLEAPQPFFEAIEEFVQEEWLDGARPLPSAGDSLGRR